MSISRSSCLTPSVENLEPHLAPSGVGGPILGSLAADRSALIADASGILQLLHKVAQSQRATVREAREIAREAQHNVIGQQAAKMREAANLSLASGIVSGVASIASGFANIQQSAQLIRTEHLKHTPPIEFDYALAELDHRMGKTSQDLSKVDDRALPNLTHNMEAMMQKVRDHMAQLVAAQRATLEAITRGHP
ncbi:type III secretion system translocon subunit SctB [Singulisphaera sp. GP187]|uniref:type III secretion system translocon subunit SctB n=1 Tax=Singulisphaera sp. GP187 TaxID=1882752 RepID=UPI00116114F4|nr:type III secretion system translocon subunit SctB [Singulisphaera sp. GP187]